MIAGDNLNFVWNSRVDERIFLCIWSYIKCLRNLLRSSVTRLDIKRKFAKGIFFAALSLHIFFMPHNKRSNSYPLYYVSESQQTERTMNFLFIILLRNMFYAVDMVSCLEWINKYLRRWMLHWDPYWAHWIDYENWKKICVLQLQLTSISYEILLRECPESQQDSATSIISTSSMILAQTKANKKCKSTQTLDILVEKKRYEGQHPSSRAISP